MIGEQLLEALLADGDWHESERRRSRNRPRKAAARFLRESSEGDTVYRRRGLHGLKSYCLECVGKWHPSWLEAAERRNPARPCAGGCGVLVTSPYGEVNARRSPQSARTCLVCGEEFTKRGDAQYCSNACRQDAYRKRKAGAA